MSVLKLESLPNEILIHFLENHANAVDILVAFSKQLNSRIDALIAQCHRFRFDFFGCRKDEFSLCVSIFPLLIDKIGELALSEWNTPGQIDAFLSSFPLFTRFINLRTLYFHFDRETIDGKVHGALISLKSMNKLTNLSIQVANKLNDTILMIIAELLCLPTLNRFCLVTDEHLSRRISMIPSTPVSLNIRHLTIKGMSIRWNELQTIIQSAPHLRYVDIRLMKERVSVSQKRNYVSFLQTLIIHFEENDSRTFEMFAKFLRTTPNLCRLEVNAHDALIKASGWEQLIETALPCLTDFILKTSPDRLKKRLLNEVIFSFQTLFWIKKSNFHLLILDEEYLLNGINTMDHIFARKQFTSNIHWNGSFEFRLPIVRPMNNEILPINIITSLHFSRNFSFPSSEYFFNNVRYLAISYPQQNLIQWIIEHVNCLRIEQLDISQYREDQKATIPLLTRAKNVQSLKLNANQLMTYQTLHLETNNQVKSLFLSDSKGVFDKSLIQTIGELFPRLEHMVIDMMEVNNIPMLRTYFPHLRSLTLNILHQFFSSFHSFERKARNYQYRTRTKLLFRCDGNWVTIWLNSAAFKKSFWNTFQTKSSSFVRKSTTANNIPKKRMKFE